MFAFLDLFSGRRRRRGSLRRMPAHLRRDIGLTDVAECPAPRWRPAADGRSWR